MLEDWTRCGGLDPAPLGAQQRRQTGPTRRHLGAVMSHSCTLQIRFNSQWNQGLALHAHRVPPAPPLFPFYRRMRISTGSDSVVYGPNKPNKSPNSRQITTAQTGV